MNDFKTSDIKISTDSMGYMTATHKHQGLLIDSTPFWSDQPRKECRAAAVEALKEMKANGGMTDWEAQERADEREANAWRFEV